MRDARGSVEGAVRVVVECAYPERVINICAQNEINFRGLKRLSETETEMTVSIQGARKLRELSRRGLFTVTEKRRYGAPFFLKGLRQRYALFLGLILAIGIVWGSSFFIWQIEVSGNEEIPSSEILAALREEGVKIGTSAFDVDNRHLQDRLLLRLPKLAWITVNIRGSRAYVLCREKIEIPDMTDKTEITASKSGLITNIIVLRGVPSVAVGDTVEKGDILAEGTDWDERAEARITARTWYEFSAAMPLSCGLKSYTGEEKSRTAVIFGEKRINFYFTGGNPYINCDKITENRRVSLPGGGLLPVEVVRESFSRWTASEYALPEEQAEAILKARLISRLNGEIGEGSVTSTNFSKTVRNGVMTLTLSAECLEEIGE